MKADAERAPAHGVVSFRWAGYTLGFSIGGFFDGILLHQVLQWHHLLSSIDGGRFGGLRFQILADGLFHVLMYALLLIGLWLLWRSRADFGRLRAGRVLLANALIGFGAWHVIDGIASHWLLGIHRIRMDSDVPLFWDLLWFTVFGVAFILAGWRLRSRGGGGTGRAAPAALAVVALITGAGAVLPPSDSSIVVIVFRPGTTPAAAFAAVARLDGRLVWSDASDQVWAVDLPENAGRVSLYRDGALLVSGSALALGCVEWFRPRPSPSRFSLPLGRGTSQRQS